MFKPKVQVPPTGPRPPKQIVLHPNPNDDGYSDCWVCEHIDCQVAKADGEIYICEECSEVADPEYVKVNAKAGQ